MAHLSQDPRLLSMLNSTENSTDVFTLLASKWYTNYAEWMEMDFCGCIPLLQAGDEY